MHAIALTTCEVVLDDDGATVCVARTVVVFLYAVSHCARGLVTSHDTVDCVAHGALNVLIFYAL